MRPFVLLLLAATAVAAVRGEPPTNLGSEGWQLAPAPVLAPGKLGEWDDFRVSSPSILRVGDTWRMYYTGARLSAEGLSSGIGMATSSDGVKWQKYSQNPLLTTEGDLEGTGDFKRIDSSSVCQLADGTFLMVYIEIDVGNGSRSLKLARAEDGLLWSVSGTDDKSFARLSYYGAVYSTCVYTDPDSSGSPGRVHLWYLTSSRERGFYDLMHTFSQDGVRWIEPLLQTGKQIEETAPIWYARVVPSGSFYLLYYMASTGGRIEESTFRFRVSRNARTWVAMGPPDFVASHKSRKLGAYGAPAVLFTAKGARLFFHEENENGSSVIGSAFCPKSSYVGSNK